MTDNRGNIRLTAKTTESRLHAYFVHSMDKVGTDPAAQIAWLGDFAERDLDTKGALGSARLEVHAFTLRQKPSANIRKMGAEDDPYFLEDQLPTEKEVVLIQAELGKLLRGLVGDESSYTLPEPTTLSLGWLPGGVRFFSHQSSVTAFILAAADLLMIVGSDLKRCKRNDCRRLFVSHKRNNVYCSTTCSNTQRTRTLRNKNRESSESRRQRHIRANRKRYGSKVRTRKNRTKK